ncbi:MAG: DUF6164 family protein [Natronospirillum sp.]
MGVLLFRLTGVPDDEAEEVRELLAAHELDTYETEAGRWHLGVAAIWLTHDAQEPEARRVLAQYQTTRSQAAQDDLAARKARGEPVTFWRNFAQRPGQVIVFVVGGIVVLALSVVPFLRLMMPS